MLSFKEFILQESYEDHGWHKDRWSEGTTHRHDSTIHGHSVKVHFDIEHRKPTHAEVDFSVNRKTARGNAPPYKTSHALAVMKHVRHKVKEFAKQNPHIKTLGYTPMDAPAPDEANDAGANKREKRKDEIYKRLAGKVTVHNDPDSHSGARIIRVGN